MEKIKADQIASKIEKIDDYIAATQNI